MCILDQIKNQEVWKRNRILKNAQELREDLVINFDVALILAKQIDSQESN